MILTSAVEKFGIDKLWELLAEHRQIMLDNDQFYLTRQNQLKLWFWSNLRENLFEILFSRPEIKKKLNQLESQVIFGNITPGQASDILIKEAANLMKF